MLNLGQNHATYATMQAKLSLAGAIGPSTTLRKGLEWFVNSASNANTSTELSTMCLLISFAEVVTSEEALPNSPQLMFNPTQKRSVKKLGAYRGAIRLILNTCKHAGITSVKAQQVCFPQVSST